jgi:hypothetical protein
MCDFDISGYLVDSISYKDLNGDGSLEFVLKIQYESSSLYDICVYGIRNNTSVQLLKNTCTDATLYDMDSDRLPELLCVNNDETGANAYAELFKYDTTSSAKQIDSLNSLGRAAITSGMRSPDKITAGLLGAFRPAIILDGTTTAADGTAAYTADIFSYTKETGLVNLSAAQDDSGALPALSFYASRNISPAYCSDIDFNGYIEFPVLVWFDSENHDSYYLSWWCFNEDGTTEEKAITYYAPSSRWYFIFPQNEAGRNLDFSHRSQYHDNILIRNHEGKPYDSSDYLRR